MRLPDREEALEGTIFSLHDNYVVCESYTAHEEEDVGNNQN